VISLAGPSPNYKQLVLKVTPSKSSKLPWASLVSDAGQNIQSDPRHGFLVSLGKSSS